MAETFEFGRSVLVLSDCFGWMEARAPESIEGVVTDPPYGLKEFSDGEQKRLRSGNGAPGYGGVWRIPPTLDGSTRSPLPRFTILSRDELVELREFFYEWATRLIPILTPGAHVLVASNPLLAHHVAGSLDRAGLEPRGQVIRLTQTLRGGDRPKGAEDEFAEVTVMPKSAWEPWVLFRKPISEGTVAANLRRWRTGALRRISREEPFRDVIASSPTRSTERDIAPHPSLKPQAFLRQVVRAILPLGEGTVLDPFAGSGSTLAAAEALGYGSIGVERDPHFFDLASRAIPTLATLGVNGETGTQTSLEIA